MGPRICAALTPYPSLFFYLRVCSTTHHLPPSSPFLPSLFLPERLPLHLRRRPAMSQAPDAPTQPVRRLVAAAAPVTPQIGAPLAIALRVADTGGVQRARARRAAPRAELDAALGHDAPVVARARLLERLLDRVRGLTFAFEVVGVIVLEGSLACFGRG